MSKNPNGSAAPRNRSKNPKPRTFSEREEAICEAYIVLEQFKKYWKGPAGHVLDALIERIGETPESIAEAKKILSSPQLFADFVELKSLEFNKSVDDEVRKRENKDIAAIRGNTALVATIFTAAGFCVLSPVVNNIEQPVLTAAGNSFNSWTHAAKQVTNFNTTKPQTAQPANEKTTTVATSAPEAKMVVLQLCGTVLCDVKTGKAPQLTGKEKIAVIVGNSANVITSARAPHRSTKAIVHHSKRHRARLCVR